MLALLLSHALATTSADWARDEASEAYGGPVDVAREGATYEL